MEKIYMEENQEPKRKRTFDFSVTLSFVVAFFAIFSLAVYGIVENQGTGVSYAADTNLGESFTFKNTTYVIKTNGTMQVPVFYANTVETGEPIFCVEHNVGTIDGTTYRRDGNIDDYGLLYLLNAEIVTPEGVVDPSTSPANVRDVKAWIRQVAIWGYLNRKYTGGSAIRKSNVLTNQYDPTTGEVIIGDNIDVHLLTNTELAQISGDNSKKLNRVADAGVGTSTLIYDGAALVGNLSSSDNSIVGKLVNNAIAYSNSGNLSVTLASKELSLVDIGDTKYYKTDVVNVVANPSNQLDHYVISFNGVKGAIAVDADGNSLPASVPASTSEFYVLVPEENVVNETQSLVISVKATFNMLNGHYYDGADTLGHGLQRVITVTGSTTTISQGTSVDFFGAPDTGINTAQTIYFIGLIVLLCGVGIVYANAKPIEQKQQ